MERVEDNTTIGHNVMSKHGIEDFKIFRFYEGNFLLDVMLRLKII